jgi:Ca-activated chloride channel family protein
VSTVALGTDNGVVVVQHPTYVERIRVPPNPAALRTIAQRTGGHFFRSAGGVDLSSVYRELGSRVGKVNKNEEITVAFAGGAVVLMLIGAALSTLLLRRLP